MVLPQSLIHDTRRSKNSVDLDSVCVENRIMKTTVDIPDDLLEQCMKYSGSKTIRGAVVGALEWYNNRERQRSLLRHVGTLPNLMTTDQLSQLRETGTYEENARRQQRVDRNPATRRKPTGKRTRGKAA